VPRGRAGAFGREKKKCRRKTVRGQKRGGSSSGRVSLRFGGQITPNIGITAVSIQIHFFQLIAANFMPLVSAPPYEQHEVRRQDPRFHFPETRPRKDDIIGPNLLHSGIGFHCIRV